MGALITKEVIPIDTVTRSGRIYPKDIVEKTIKKFSERDQPLLGELDFPNSPNDVTTINIDRVSHVVKNLYISDNKLMATIRLLETPMGNILRELLESGVKIRPGMRGCGTVDNNVVTKYDLIAVDLVNDHVKKETPPVDMFTIIDGMEKDGVI